MRSLTGSSSACFSRVAALQRFGRRQPAIDQRQVQLVQQRMQQQAALDRDDGVGAFVVRLAGNAASLGVRVIAQRAGIVGQQLHEVAVAQIQQPLVVRQRDQFFDRRVLDPAQPAELVGHYLAFQRQLPFVGDVLPLAAAAQTRPEVGAGRRDAVGRRLHDPQQAGARPARLLLDDLDLDGLAGDGVGHEDDLAVVVADCLAAVGDAGQGNGGGHGWFLVGRKDFGIGRFKRNPGPSQTTPASPDARPVAKSGNQKLPPIVTQRAGVS